LRNNCIIYFSLHNDIDDMSQFLQVDKHHRGRLAGAMAARTGRAGFFLMIECYSYLQKLPLKIEIGIFHATHTICDVVLCTRSNRVDISRYRPSPQVLLTFDFHIADFSDCLWLLMLSIRIFYQCRPFRANHVCFPGHPRPSSASVWPLVRVHPVAC